MCHEENYKIQDYNNIWTDVSPYIKEADLAFANIEAPIDPLQEFSAYPYFNMPKDYLVAAIDAGFDVFSLSNNHTNDKKLEGMEQTMLNTSQLKDEYDSKKQNIYFSGLKPSPEAPFSYNVIEKDGWKILFIAMTELLNKTYYNGYINYVPPVSSHRESFINYCKKLREENPCDVFVISIHTAEPEYRRNYTESQENFYRKLMDTANADIIWANHAHIIKDRKIFMDYESNSPKKLIMFANGNTISGQRRDPSLYSANPEEPIDNTGDGLFYTISLSKGENGIYINSIRPLFITTYINPDGDYILKPLDAKLIKSLNETGDTVWAEYLTKRLQITKKRTKDIFEWQ